MKKYRVSKKLMEDVTYTVGTKVRWYDPPSHSCAPGYGIVKEIDEYGRYTVEWDDGTISDEIEPCYLKAYRKPATVYRDQYYQNQWRRTEAFTNNKSRKSKKLEENSYEENAIIKRMEANLRVYYYDDLCACDTVEDIIELIKSVFPDAEKYIADIVAEDLMQFVYAETEDTPNEDHEADFDDANSAYYMGGNATLEDYMDAQEWEAYDPYDDYDGYDE